MQTSTLFIMYLLAFYSGCVCVCTYNVINDARLLGQSQSRYVTMYIAYCIEIECTCALTAWESKTSFD